MKPLAVSLTGISKSSNTSVSYFLFWHNQSSKLSRHDRIWQVPRTLAKIDKEKAEGSHFGFSLPISLVSYVFGKCLFWKRVLCPMSNITYSHNTLWSIQTFSPPRLVVKHLPTHLPAFTVEIVVQGMILRAIISEFPREKRREGWGYCYLKCRFPGQPELTESDSLEGEAGEMHF